MSNDVQTSIDINVSADVSFSEILTEIGQNFLPLYTDKWFLAAILVAFFAGQVAHAILRGYWPGMRDLSKAMYIWGIQLVVGYFAAIELMDSPDEAKLAALCGINSIAAYYLLLWTSTRWLKWPRFAQFLSLRKTQVNDKGEIEFGETIQFLRPKGK